MSSFSTPAIMLRRIDFGDYDLIVTFFTLNKGKISVIAKSAKKSTKRFAGILELFSVLDVVCSISRGKGLPVLQEAILKHPFSNIRSKIIKTAYASYWAELINQWMEKGQKQVQLFHLFRHVLSELDLGNTSEEALSILFQIRFLTIAGLGPNLKQCSICRAEMEKMKETRINFDLSKGGIICGGCASGNLQKIFLSKGTIKHLLWIQRGDLTRAVRIKFASRALMEGLEFLEVFVPYHLGKEPRSLKFLRQIRE
ncbi:MAG: DNA repair protein RecO [Deltaproteobacteria bacterium]|nr:DNA repair protein RecO [Deltaproteobacteria bacterium]MBW2641848.1 DNA repair protein RecO [Deltaproteobacteria bacterium]